MFLLKALDFLYCVFHLIKLQMFSDNSRSDLQTGQFNSQTLLLQRPAFEIWAKWFVCHHHAETIFTNKQTKQKNNMWKKQMLFLNMRIWVGINGASQMYQAQASLGDSEYQIRILLCEHRGITAWILPSVHLITVTPHFGLNRKFNWKLKDEFFVILQPKLKSKSRYDTCQIYLCEDSLLMTHCSCCCFAGRTRRCRQHTWADRKWQYSWADREHIHPDLETHTEWSSVFYNSFYGQKVSLSELSFSVILWVSLWSTVQLSSSLPSLQSSSPSQRNAEGMHWPFLHSSRPWLLQAANTHTHLLSFLMSCSNTWHSSKSE